MILWGMITVINDLGISAYSEDLSEKYSRDLQLLLNRLVHLIPLLLESYRISQRRDLELR